MKKTFNYVNNMGYNKTIILFLDKVNDKGEYYNEIWSGQNDTMETTGMFCGGGYSSKEELNRFFKHYKIDYRME